MFIQQIINTWHKKSDPLNKMVKNTFFVALGIICKKFQIAIINRLAAGPNNK
jgi:hypothetical protein